MRILMGLLAVGLMLPVGVRGQDYQFKTNGNAITITKYIGAGGAVSIPEKINGLAVTSIGNEAFWNCPNLTSVTIPNSVTSIGERAFGNPLTSVTIPASVTSIGNEAFIYCDSLATLTVDALNPAYCSVNGVLFDKRQTTLIQYSGWEPKSYTIPNSVTNIGIRAFNSCDLTNITIPASVTSIAVGAFQRCLYLTGVYFNGDAPSLGAGVFAGSKKAIVYYLPTTTGWDKTFGGRPTAVWKQ